MTKLLAFSSAIPGKPAMLPAISGKPVLLSVIPGKLAMLPAISDKSAFPRQFQTSRLFPGNFRQTGFSPAISDNKKLHPASVFSDRLLQCSFSFFSFYSVRILHPGRFHFRLSHPGRSRSQALTPKPITISGSHTQANHNLRLSHRPGDLPTYCSFRSPLR